MQTAEYVGACGKDPGILTVSIAAQMWIKNGPSNPTTWDTLNDTLAVKIEAPTVNSFQVSDNSGPGVGASPFWFGRISGFDPNPAGTYLGFAMARGTPPAKDWAGFWANVTNTTHYDLRLCFVQTVDFSISRSYTNGVTDSAAGTNNLDIGQLNITYHYNDYEMRLGRGATSQIPINNALPQDSPGFRAPNSTGPASYLKQMRFHAEFDTHLVVDNGWQSNGPSVPSKPIALSTSTWHLDGAADNTANIANPGGASQATTLNMANWLIKLAAGAGPSPPSLPGTNTPWTAPGDGTRKYLIWNGNSFTSLGTLAATAGLASEGSAGAIIGSSAWNSWDHALAMLAEVGVIPPDMPRPPASARRPRPTDLGVRGLLLETA